MFGEHAIYIIPAYAITFVVIGALIGWSCITWRARLGELAELDKLGFHRRTKDGGDV